MADMASVAAQVAEKETQVMQRKEVKGDLFTRDLKSLNTALEADTIVCRFKDPTDPEGDPIDIEMTPMTPGQFAIYRDTLFGHTLIETALSASETEGVDDRLEREQEQRLQDELAVKKYDDRLLNILESCIINYPGLTAEDLKSWNPFYVMSLHNALLQGSRPSKPVAQFPGLDSEGRE